ncbi:MAG TPA: hypothetical protein VHG27_03860 [Xanthobacteraceae bacterium]|nr:hypothetical protein [Xanthobacteraceae bacterium]
MLRSAFVLLSLAVAVPAAAQELTAEQARRFVIGKTFAYNCFDGSRGAGRIRADGSVVGTIQMQGKGPTRYAALPANTLRVKGERVCASLSGVPFEPCFNLTQTGSRSFRGSVAGFGFAYCDFTRGGGRRGFIRAATRKRLEPVALRPTLSE